LIKLDITLTTPALFFPALSLLMLAYTNRFLALANLIRNLHAELQKSHDPIILGQIDNLTVRVELLKYMQATGAASILGSVLCILVLFAGWQDAGKVLFVISLLLLVASLVLSIREIWISVGALNLHLGALRREERSTALNGDHDNPVPDRPNFK
jgi:hypothetical protein